MLRFQSVAKPSEFHSRATREMTERGCLCELCRAGPLPDPSRLDDSRRSRQSVFASFNRCHVRRHTSPIN